MRDQGRSWLCCLGVMWPWTKDLNSEPQFFHLENGGQNAYLAVCCEEETR